MDWRQNLGRQHSIRRVLALPFLLLNCPLDHNLRQLDLLLLLRDAQDPCEALILDPSALRRIGKNLARNGNASRISCASR